MADEWRRYLAQQVELGGAEIVLGDRPVAPREVPRVEAPAAVPEVPVAAAAMPEPVAVEAVEPPRPAMRVEAPEEPPLPEPPPELMVDEEYAMAKPVTPRGQLLPSGAGAKSKDWRKGAPPIPGPGLTVNPPTPELLGSNGLHELETLEQVADRIRSTFCCDLCPKRTHAVPGEGNPKARLVVVGEGPGANEDATGRPFVGQAGQLLDSILAAIDVPRETVFITNIVKCRPPMNRKPLPEEVAACIPYLHRQLEILRPKVLLALGATAAESLLGARKSLGEMRGKVHRYAGIPLVVTYHPAALLRNPNWKKPTWDDVRIARQLLDA